MNKKIFIIIGILLVAFGTVLAAFTDVPIIEFPALASVFVGAALACVGIYRKSEKKDWKVLVSIITVAMGAFLLALGGVSENTVTQIISAISGVIIIIIGIIGSLLLKPVQELKE